MPANAGIQGRGFVTGERRWIPAFAGITVVVAWSVERATEMSNVPRILVLGGPTAVGKTAAAVELAEDLGGEIVNADSMQVYRGLDLGTAKPTSAERESARFHLVDVWPPEVPFHAGEFVRLADAAIAAIRARGRVPIVCGGTGMYVRALVRGLFAAPPVDPALRDALYRAEQDGGPGTLHARLAAVDPDKAARIPAADRLRLVRALEVHAATGKTLSDHHRAHAQAPPRYDAFLACLTADREALHTAIDRRVGAMIAAGLPGEVRALLARGVPRSANAMQGLGYKQLAAHLAGEEGLAEAVDRIRRETRRYAKRQLTWWRAQPGVRWFAVPGDLPALHAEARAFIDRH
jgi:tRNA dimethylallyltransferase